MSNQNLYFVDGTNGEHSGATDIVLADDRERAKAIFARSWRAGPGGLRVGAIGGRVWLPGTGPLVDRGRDD